MNAYKIFKELAQTALGEYGWKEREKVTSILESLLHYAPFHETYTLWASL